jgi:hypothetical protein
MTETPVAAVPDPAAIARPPITLLGQDVQTWIPHWRDGRVHRVELRLLGGDRVFLDVFALRLFFEICTQLCVSDSSPRI